MPTILRLLGFRFHFYSDEGNEPPHTHVAKDDCEVKFWRERVVLARNRGMTAKDIRVVERMVMEHQAFLKERYYERVGCASKCAPLLEAQTHGAHFGAHPTKWHFHGH